MTPPRRGQGLGATAPGSIETVILDVDGTLVTCPYDFDAMRAEVANIAARWGLDAKSVGTRGVIEQISILAARLGHDGPAFAEEVNSAVAAMEVASASHARLLPGAAAALDTLRQRGISVALITRNCRAAANIVLRGISSYDLLLTRDDVPRAKPDPDHIHRCLAALGAAPDRTAVVGDHTYDIEAGRAAGVRLCIGVRTGSSSDRELSDAGSDLVLDTVADLPAWLESREESQQ